MHFERAVQYDRRNFIFCHSKFLHQNPFKLRNRTFALPCELCEISDPCRVRRIDEAIDCFKRVLNADNSHYLTSLDHRIFGYKSMRVLAQAEFGLGNYGAARDLWLQAAAAMPKDLSSTVELASAATEVKDFPTASAMIDRVRDVMGFGNIWVNLSIPFQDAIGGPGSGFRFIAGLLEKNPEYHDVRLTLAEHLIEAGLPNDAVPHLLFLDDRGLPQASYHMGKLCLVSGDMKGALTWMERSQELNPAHIETNETIEKLRLAIAS